MLLATYFVLVIALPLALGVYVLYNGLPRSRRCPACVAETVRMRSRAYDLISLGLRGEQLQRRWCMECGWSGGARIRHAPLPVSAGAATTPPPRVLSTECTADSVDIRRLAVDGRDVRVMVQCWAEQGEWLGRLLFIGPAGETWMEEGSSLSGRSALEVLSRALTLPDRTLAGRFRQVVR